MEFHELGVVCCSQVLGNGKCPELPAGQLFSGAQIPQLYLLLFWLIDFAWYPHVDMFKIKLQCKLAALYKVVRAIS